MPISDHRVPSNDQTLLPLTSTSPAEVWVTHQPLTSLPISRLVKVRTTGRQAKDSARPGSSDSSVRVSERTNGRRWTGHLPLSLGCM